MNEIKGMEIPFVPPRQSKDNVQELQLYMNDNSNQFINADFREIQSFISEEQLYVTKLKKLQDARRIIEGYQAPETDLKSLFGVLESITELHGRILPARLAACQKIEDIFDLFANHINMFGIYIYDQWMKSKNKFTGKQALLKKLDPEDVNNLNLPEQRIIEYINFHEHLKKSLEHVKNSELFLKSFQALRNLVLQMQYARDLASVKSLPYSVNGFVRFIDNFQVKCNSRFMAYRIYFCMNCLYLVNEAMHFDFEINTREISLNSMEDDELLFELTVMPENKVYIFKSETPNIKNAWVELLKEILYWQVEQEKLKLKNSIKVS